MFHSRTRSKQVVKATTNSEIQTQNQWGGHIPIANRWYTKRAAAASSEQDQTRKTVDHSTLA